MTHKIDFASIPWDTPIKGVRHKVMKQGDRQLRLVEHTKDLEPHWCEKGHISYVLQGQLEITFENERVLYNPGDGVFIPSGKEHKHMGLVLSDFVRVIFVEDEEVLASSFSQFCECLKRKYTDFDQDERSFLTLWGGLYNHLILGNDFGHSEEI